MCDIISSLFRNMLLRIKKKHRLNLQGYWKIFYLDIYLTGNTYLALPVYQTSHFALQHLHQAIFYQCYSGAISSWWVIKYTSVSMVKRVWSLAEFSSQNYHFFILRKRPWNPYEQKQTIDMSRLFVLQIKDDPIKKPGKGGKKGTRLSHRQLLILFNIA